MWLELELVTVAHIRYELRTIRFLEYIQAYMICVCGVSVET